MKELLVLSAITDPLMLDRDFADKDLEIEFLKAKLREANAIAMKAIRLAKSTTFITDDEVQQLLSNLEATINEVPDQEKQIYMYKQFDLAKFQSLEDPILKEKLRAFLLEKSLSLNIKPLKHWENV